MEAVNVTKLTPTSRVGDTVKSTARLMLNREPDNTYTIALAHEGAVVWVGPLNELTTMLAERILAERAVTEADAELAHIARTGPVL